MRVRLPHDNNRTFHICQLLRHLIRERRDFIIQGQQHVTLNEHTKPSSLDYWLRTIAVNQDTAQAVNDVVIQICDTGLFEIVNDLVCPDNGNLCRGIRLVNG